MNEQDKTVVQQAIEVLDNLLYWDNGKPEYDEARKTINALRQLLEQPEPEPDIFPDEAYEMGLERIAYYTTPPAQPEPDSDWKDRLIAQHEETILWQAKRIAELLEQPEPVQSAERGYQWLDTSVFRKKLPENAEPDAWNALYTTPPIVATPLAQPASQHSEKNGY